MQNPDAQPAQVVFRGDAAQLFPLALGTGLLSIVTLGIYRFWAKARIRRHVWSRVVLDGDALEYTGTGLEKFLGFLMAVVVLAVYLAVVQLILFSFGIRFLMDPRTEAEEIAQGVSILLSFAAILPLILFAVYRARRYKLARTLWRGIRFGMDGSAWGYVLRALGYGALAVGSLGLLWPLMTFRLEAYMTDRMHWGTARFRQGGAWTGLYPALRPYVAGLACAVIGVALVMAEREVGYLPLAAGLVVMAVGAVIYPVRAFGYLTRHKTLGDGISFGSDPRAGQVIWLYIKGGFLTGLTGSVASGAIFGVIGVAVAGLGDPQEFSALLAAEVVALGIVGYLVMLSVLSALSLVFIAQPVLAHFVGTMRVAAPEGFGAIRQSTVDRGADAEGFADALDIGGAF